MGFPRFSGITDIPERNWMDFGGKSEVCSGGFIALRPSQSRIPPVRSYRRESCPCCVSSPGLRPLPAATRNCQQIRVQTSRKLSALIKIGIDSEAVDGLTAAAVLFDLDAKEMNPGTSSKGKTTIPKREKSSTQHNKRGGGSTHVIL